MGWWLAAAGLLLLAALLAASRWAYGVAFGVPAEHPENAYDLPTSEQYLACGEQTRALIAEMEAIPFEAVRITAADGTVLCGRYYHVRDGAPLQIQCHGYRGSALRDFCGGNKLAREMGQNTLVIDQRAHGQSGGRTITFGVRERQDCAAWVRYAAGRFGAQVPIFLSGVSMGAATVLMASGLALDGHVVGVIADCPYSCPRDIIRKVCRDMKLPVGLAWPFVVLGARLWGGFSPNGASAVEAVRGAKVPILLMHGEDDRFVPCAMSREIAAANPAMVQLETFSGAGHGLSYMVDGERYAALTRTFVEKCLANA